MAGSTSPPGAGMAAGSPAPSTTGSPSASPDSPRAMEKATYPSRAANRANRRRSSTRNAIDPPTNAPMAVNSSRLMPRRRLATWRSRYTAAAALLVMITHTSDTPTAARRSSPKPRVSNGTIRRPPPSPSRDPKTPAAKPPTSMSSPTSTSGVTRYAMLTPRPANRYTRSEVGGGAPRRHPPEDLRAQVLGGVRQQGYVAGALEGDGQLALVPRAGAGLAARLDLGPLGQVAAEAIDLLVIDERGLVGAERADLAPASVAIEVVALAGSGGRHGSGS